MKTLILTILAASITGSMTPSAPAAQPAEEPDWSDWCMSVLLQGGKEHMFATRWPEDAARGHLAWPQSSIVHAVAAQPTGPFKVIGEIGPGRNVLHYQTRDGIPL